MELFGGIVLVLMYQTPSLLAELFGGIVLVLVVGIFYEGLKTLREILAVYEANKNKPKKASINAKEGENDVTPLLTEPAPVKG